MTFEEWLAGSEQPEHEVAFRECFDAGLAQGFQLALEAAAKLFPVEHDEDAPRGSRVCVCDEYLACYIHKQLKTLIPKPDRS
jgi:hypothetical protein